ncbi:hypothetical protein LPJ61_006142, partial [Coemansia biformis]
RKEKYAEQDDEDRDLRMTLLGAAGKKDPAAASPKTEEAPKTLPPKKADVADSEEPAQQCQPPSIVDQLADMAVEGPEGTSGAEEDLDDAGVEPSAKAADVEHGGAEADDDDDDDEERAAELLTEQLDVLDTLTAAPMAGDNLAFAIPVCAPYPALAAYKYRVKLVPGVMKKGKACKMAQTVMLAAADSNRPRSTSSSDPTEAERLELEDILAQREKSLIKGIPEMEMIAQMLGKVKVTAPNIESIKQKTKAAAKSRAKAKSAQDDS